MLASLNTFYARVASNYMSDNLSDDVITREDLQRNTVARKIDAACNMRIYLLQQRCRYLKSVESCATRCGNKWCVKNC